MIRLKKFVELMVEKAASKAFPIAEKCIFEEGDRVDLKTSFPKSIFEKYKTGIHTFGMFNEREIADCIFVNCEKSEIVRAVQVSGVGELQVLINDKFICEEVNGIVKNGLKIKSEGFEKVFLCWLMEKNTEAQSMTGFRTELLMKSISQTIELFGGISKSRKLIFDAQEEFEYHPGEIHRVAINSSDIKSWIQKFSSVLLETDQCSSVFFLFNYSNTANFFSGLSSTGSIHKVAYGEVFVSDPLLSTTYYKPVVNHLAFTSSIPSLYFTSVLNYSLLKLPTASCSLLCLSSVQSMNSIWSTLAIYPTLINSFPADFTVSEIQQNVRPVLIHILTLPDTLHICITSCSMHILITWLEKLCELYLNTHSLIPLETLPKLNFLLKSVIDSTFFLLHISLPLLFKNK